ncbi:MAG: hypothetical protein ABJQ38_04725 [Flavobacteriaceae bacterium]
MELPITFSGGSEIRLLVRTGARNSGSSRIFDEKSRCPQNWKYGRTEQSNYDSGETEKFWRKLSEN